MHKRQEIERQQRNINVTSSSIHPSKKENNNEKGSTFNTPKIDSVSNNPALINPSFMIQSSVDNFTITRWFLTASSISKK